MPAGASSAAACISIALYESRRRLPTIPRTFIDLRLRLDQLQVDGDRDVVADGLAAVGQRRVPVDAELGAVDDGGRLDRDAVLAVEVLRRAGERAGGLDRLGDAAQRQLALEDEA